MCVVLKMFLSVLIYILIYDDLAISTSRRGGASNGAARAGLLVGSCDGEVVRRRCSNIPRRDDVAARVHPAHALVVNHGNRLLARAVHSQRHYRRGARAERNTGKVEESAFGVSALVWPQSPSTTASPATAPVLVTLTLYRIALQS